MSVRWQCAVHGRNSYIIQMLISSAVSAVEVTVCVNDTVLSCEILFFYLSCVELKS